MHVVDSLAYGIIPYILIVGDPLPFYQKLLVGVAGGELSNMISHGLVY